MFLQDNKKTRIDTLEAEVKALKGEQMTRASDTARLLSGGAVINEDSNDIDFC